MSLAIVFKCLAFDKLSLQQLYAIMALRQAVFVVEQNCPYVDADNKDQAAYHLMALTADGTLVAYARLLPPDTSYPIYASIGRVITHTAVRRTGLGRQLMKQALEWINNLWDYPSIKISAQTYLIPFYESFGFEKQGAIYLEDNAPHIAMIRKNEHRK
ncbi:MAG: GNAT family N-acetyltransferase [Saprospiraceae bacterium]|nr:GNAT family N-acetyltransferase [Saprospiraceae bacterium]